MDGELFATLQRATWLVMADKAGDEQNAIAAAARDGLLPNLVGPNWDPAHCIRACTKNPFAAEPLLGELVRMLQKFFNKSELRTGIHRLSRRPSET